VGRVSGSRRVEVIGSLVELVGIEPTASSLRTKTSAGTMSLIRFDCAPFSAIKSPAYWNSSGTGSRKLRQFLYCSPLCRRNNLRVDVHRGRDPGVPHLTLNGFRIGASLYQPSGMRCSQAAPVNEWQSHLMGSRLDESFQDVVIPHRLPVFHGLEDEIVRVVRFYEFVFSDCPPRPNFHGEILQAKDASNHFRRYPDRGRTGC